MFLLSIKARRHLWEISLTFAVVFLVWILQSDILVRLTSLHLFCNLPLTFTMIWASIYTSHFAPLSSDDIKVRSLGNIALYQAISGSLSGAAIGAIFAAFYSSVVPVYMVSYPLIGWIAGYFPLRKVQHGSFYSILLVLCGTVLAEFITAVQLILMGRAEVFGCFVQIAIPEAVLNALIAPFIFVPLKSWYDFGLEREVIVES